MLAPIFKKPLHTPHAFGMMQGQTRKRARDESHDFQNVIATEKKPRLHTESNERFASFPYGYVQSSPPPGQDQWLPGVVAATECFQSTEPRDKATLSTQGSLSDVDMGSDDCVSITGSHSSPSSLRGTHRPARLFPSPYRQGALAEDRIPTPIHTGFNVGNLMCLASQTSAPTPPRDPSFGSSLNLITLPLRRPAFRDHSMPSPIQEASSSPYDYSAPPFCTALAAAPAPTTMTAAAATPSKLSIDVGECMDTDDLVNRGSPVRSSLFALPSPSTGRRRSGALATEKRRYAVGYREDCEKCRMKVPGHYSHFLPVNEP